MVKFKSNLKLHWRSVIQILGCIWPVVVITWERGAAESSWGLRVSSKAPVSPVIYACWLHRYVKSLLSQPFQEKKFKKRINSGCWIKCDHVVAFPCSLHEIKYASLPSLNCSSFLSPFTLEVPEVHTGLWLKTMHKCSAVKDEFSSCKKILTEQGKG